VLKVRSLTHTIILQFAIIIAPIALVLLYQALSDIRHADSVRFELQSVRLAHQARDSYKIFLNGVADAVDTGSLSNKARQALVNTKDSLAALQSWDRTFQADAVLVSINTLLDAVRRNPSLQDLLPLRETANKVNGVLTKITETYEAREQQNIENVAHDVRQQVWIVLTVMCLTLASAVGFVFLLIRGLTEPLNRAVTLAGDIAAGDFRAEKSIDTSRDIGGLLASLVKMRSGLGRAFLDLAKNETRLANAQRIAQIGDWELDIAKQTITRSDEVCRIFGRTPDQLSHSSIFSPELIHPDDRALVQRSMHSAIFHGKNFNIDFSVFLPNRDTRVVNTQVEVKTDASGKPMIVAGTIQDITARKAAEDQIRHLALHDGLTGLSNRQLFKEKVDQAILSAERQGSAVTVMFLDLDRFKNVNDTLGHGAGDTLLKEVTRRLQNSLRESDTISRIQQLQDDDIGRQGGDEFTILIGNLMRGDQAARIAQRMLTAIGKPFIIDGNEVGVTASIGISVFPLDGENSESLLKNADAAMYHAKEQGKNNYQFFSKSISEIASNKLALENGLRKALLEEQFVLYFQPRVNAVSGTITGAEALIRWNHPERGIVLPAEFIPMAEESGLIVPIGEWVLRVACLQAVKLHKAGFKEIGISVNMASPNFKQSNLVQIVSAVLKESGLDPTRLEIEMTESLMMQDVETVIPILNQLKALGIKLSIDDFGTGYSSLSYLKSFPIDTLKIDRAFVSGIGLDSKDAALTTAIISIAKSLDLKVIAEGVETEDQMRFLSEQGCTHVQGYLYSRPLPFNEFMLLLRQKNPFPALQFAQQLS
jgi:diguanylate cyclase (GGDEF)-like protein/PAS domain S-box-containing protein